MKSQEKMTEMEKLAEPRSGSTSGTLGGAEGSFITPLALTHPKERVERKVLTLTLEWMGGAEVFNRPELEKW